MKKPINWNRINSRAIDYGHCDRCNCALIQFSPDDMCMLCELHLDIEWNLRHKDDVNNEI
jgi:hypothetical protein